MSKGSVILLFLLVFALVNTSLAVMNIYDSSALGKLNRFEGPTNAGSSTVRIMTFGVRVVQSLDERSTVLAPTSWILLGALVVWRGRVKTAWLQAGLDEPIFELFINAKGARTRTELLEIMSADGKDRFQASRELGIHWRAVDRHVKILLNHGLLVEKVAYGRVKMYTRSSLGDIVLRTVERSSSPALKTD